MNLTKLESKYGMHKKSQKIQGLVGDIEIRVSQPKSFNTEKLKAVILSHPHPLYGGTMDNKVVTTMQKAFLNLGYLVITHNFRGVGASAGEYDSGQGESADLKQVVNWVKTEFKPNECILGGFSFGSYVTLKSLVEIKDITAVLIIAPPVGLYDFSEIKDVHLPWLLVQGGQDEVVDANEILDWARQQTPRPDILWREQSSHFFHGELVWLRKMIEAYFA